MNPTLSLVNSIANFVCLYHMSCRIHYNFCAKALATCDVQVELPRQYKWPHLSEDTDSSTVPETIWDRMSEERVCDNKQREIGG